jgi:hypothetical protein
MNSPNHQISALANKNMACNAAATWWAELMLTKGFSDDTIRLQTRLSSYQICPMS